MFPVGPTPTPDNCGAWREREKGDAQVSVGVCLSPRMRGSLCSSTSGPGSRGKVGSHLQRASQSFGAATLQRVSSHLTMGKKTILLTDGAPCYIRLAKDLGIQHEAVNHSLFVRPSKDASTYTVTLARLILSGCSCFVLKTLSSHSDTFLLYAKAFQWRYRTVMHSCRGALPSPVGAAAATQNNDHNQC